MMELQAQRLPDEKSENAEASPLRDGAKITRQGIVLVPQPSSDPRDPLVRSDDNMHDGVAAG